MVQSLAVLEDALQKKARNGLISYYDFVQTALYEPSCGYYAKAKKRVGRDEASDFYTAQSLGSVFKNSIKASLHSLCSENLNTYTWVEIGAEPGQALMGEEDGFLALKTFSFNAPVSLEGPCIVFANEVLDAQPFYRLCYIKGAWHEVAVTLKEGALREVLSPPFSKELTILVDQLPKPHQEGYILDVPLGAEHFLLQWVREPWEGLLLLLDYGKDWNSFLYETPQGSARAYYKHQISRDLLAHAGDQDITMHVCWDNVESILLKNGLNDIQLYSQASFFIKYALPVIEPIISSPGFSREKQTLKELIFPQHMGTKFQVLSAMKPRHPISAQDG